MILGVVRLPDPSLKLPCRPVRPGDPLVESFIRDMLETMNHHPRCVGLAANQVGKAWRVIVVEASRIDKPGTQHGTVVLLNPRITRSSGQVLLREGCLSVPDYTGNVRRFTSVEVQGLNRAGQPVTLQAEGFEAVVFQHELDHLEGKLFLDRVSSLATDVFRRKNYG